MENLKTQENRTFQIPTPWAMPGKRDVTYYVDRLTWGMIMAQTEE